MADGHNVARKAARQYGVSLRSYARLMKKPLETAIVVSPAMIKAGAEVLADRAGMDDFAVVAEIYRAMVREALRTERSDRPPHLQ